MSDRNKVKINRRNIAQYERDFAAVEKTVRALHDGTAVPERASAWSLAGQMKPEKGAVRRTRALGLAAFAAVFVLIVGAAVVLRPGMGTNMSASPEESMALYEAAAPEDAGTQDDAALIVGDMAPQDEGIYPAGNYENVELAIESAAEGFAHIINQYENRRNPEKYSDGNVTTGGGDIGESGGETGGTSSGAGEASSGAGGGNVATGGYTEKWEFDGYDLPAHAKKNSVDYDRYVIYSYEESGMRAICIEDQQSGLISSSIQLTGGAVLELAVYSETLVAVCTLETAISGMQEELFGGVEILEVDLSNPGEPAVTGSYAQEGAFLMSVSDSAGIYIATMRFAVSGFDYSTSKSYVPWLAVGDQAKALGAEHVYLNSPLFSLDYVIVSRLGGASTEAKALLGGEGSLNEIQYLMTQFGP